VAFLFIVAEYIWFVHITALSIYTLPHFNLHQVENKPHHTLILLCIYSCAVCGRKQQKNTIGANKGQW
jgi:hypothetical protein